MFSAVWRPSIGHMPITKVDLEKSLFMTFTAQEFTSHICELVQISLIRHKLSDTSNILFIDSFNFSNTAFKITVENVLEDGSLVF